MVKAVSYFNPWSDIGTWRDFNRIGSWQKVAAIGFTALEAFVMFYCARHRSWTVLSLLLPIAGLCLIGTFRAAVAFAAPQTKTITDEAWWISKEPLNFTSIEGMTANQIKHAICERKIKRLLSPSQELGSAINNGDCFYDAIAQLLRMMKKEASIECLRKDICDALTDPIWRKHLESKIKQDPRGIVSFADYCRDVGKTTAQMGAQGPIWGDAQREGVIFAEKYQFNLRVFQAGFIEGNVVGDGDLKTLENLKAYFQEHEPESPLIAEHEARYQTRYRQLCNLEANYFTEEHTLPEKSPYPVTLTIALFGEHFVPVFDHCRGNVIVIEHFS